VRARMRASTNDVSVSVFPFLSKHITAQQREEVKLDGPSFEGSKVTEEWTYELLGVTLVTLGRVCVCVCVCEFCLSRLVLTERRTWGSILNPRIYQGSFLCLKSKEQQYKLFLVFSIKTALKKIFERQNAYLIDSWSSRS